MKRQGFTLLELITVIAVLAVLSSLMAPVFAKATKSGKITRSMGQMRQYHVAAMIYASDLGDEGPPELGLPLPPGPWVYETVGLIPKGFNRTGGQTGKHPGVYTWLPPMGPSLENEKITADWVRLVRTHEGSLVFLVDESWNGDVGDMDWTTKVALGLSWSGTIQRKSGRGSLTSQEFWQGKSP